MYIPKHYREEDRQKILAFLRQQNFPALVSFDSERLVATHTPTEVVVDDRGGLTIFGHLSRANPQWRSFGQQEVLLIFQGAHTYISPRWYNHLNVPTWNYMMIHVYGQVRLLPETELHAFLSRLVQAHEAESSYRLEGLPPAFVDKQMQGIVGFAVEVTRLDAGYKLSQNRNDEDHANIVHSLDQRADANSSNIASAMRAQRPASTGT